MTPHTPWMNTWWFSSAMMPTAARVVAAKRGGDRSGGGQLFGPQCGLDCREGAQTSKIELMRLMPRPGPACGRLLQAATAQSTLPNVVRSQLRRIEG